MKFFALKEVKKRKLKYKILHNENYWYEDEFFRSFLLKKIN
jgi:hypothetical protein